MGHVGLLSLEQLLWPHVLWVPFTIGQAGVLFPRHRLHVRARQSAHDSQLATLAATLKHRSLATGRWTFDVKVVEPTQEMSARLSAMTDEYVVQGE